MHLYFDVSHDVSVDIVFLAKIGDPAHFEASELVSKNFPSLAEVRVR